MPFFPSQQEWTMGSSMPMSFMDVYVTNRAGSRPPTTRQTFITDFVLSEKTSLPVPLHNE